MNLNRSFFSFFPLVTCQLFTFFCPAQLPDTDIWLFDMKDSAGTLSVTNGVNITNRPGYDNQPSFSPDGSYILYSSIRDKQSDVYKYDIGKKTITQLCGTTESEYSPMVTPDGKYVSVVRVEKDSTQRIWKFPVKGKPEFSLVMDKVDSVGYYAWYNSDSMAIYVLTEPHSLQMVNVKEQKPKVMALNMGRCFFWYRGGPLFYYFQRNAHGKGEDGIMLYYISGKESGAAVVKKPVENSEDFTLVHLEVDRSTVGFQILMGSGPLLFSGSSMELMTDWKKVADLSAYGITKITRIAISPDQKRIAIVSNK